jgi:hypothetical protein
MHGENMSQLNSFNALTQNIPFLLAEGWCYYIDSMTDTNKKTVHLLFFQRPAHWQDAFSHVFSPRIIVTFTVNICNPLFWEEEIEFTINLCGNIEPSVHSNIAASCAIKKGTKYSPAFQWSYNGSIKNLKGHMKDLTEGNLDWIGIDKSLDLNRVKVEAEIIDNLFEVGLDGTHSCTKCLDQDVIVPSEVEPVMLKSRTKCLDRYAMEALEVNSVETDLRTEPLDKNVTEASKKIMSESSTIRLQKPANVAVEVYSNMSVTDEDLEEHIQNRHLAECVRKMENDLSSQIEDETQRDSISCDQLTDFDQPGGSVKIESELIDEEKVTKQNMDANLSAVSREQMPFNNTSDAVNNSVPAASGDVTTNKERKKLLTKINSEVPNKNNHSAEVICKICGWRSPTGSITSLYSHKHACHGKEGPLKCDQCSKILKNKRNYNIHIKLVPTHKEVKCDRCPNITFRNEDILRIHNYKQHGESNAIQKSRHCNQCPKLFSTKEDLEVHIKKSHSGEAICKYCRWKSPSGSLMSLKSHILQFHGTGKVSDSEEPIKCTQCLKVKGGDARIRKERRKRKGLSQRRFRCFLEFFISKFQFCKVLDDKKRILFYNFLF